MRRRAIEQLQIRRNRAQEVNVRNRSRIDNRKYFGIKKNIKEYEKIIFNNLYDEELFNSIVKEGATEGLSDLFQEYLAVVTNRFFNFAEVVSALFDDTFEKGSKRVQTKNGELVKFGEVQDDQALEIIKNRQFTYLKNITDRQADIVQQEIAKGLEQGLSIPEVSNNLQKKVKSFTKSRANTIARTEMVKAHNEGTLNTMRELGVETYIYWTAGDKKVAEICRKNQGSRSKPNVYQVKGAGNPNQPLPVINSHPNCRCSILIND